MKQKEVFKRGTFIIKDLGLMEYREAYDIQQKCIEDVLRHDDEHVLICEHPSVLTLGRLATEDNIFSREGVEKRGIKVLKIDRGGEVTLHCPGQIILYPILNLKNYKKDLKYYLYKLEQVAIDFLRSFDILACRIPGHTGVWVDTSTSSLKKKKKIVSMGIGVRKWISYHGMAVNVKSDLELFSLIKPCGLDVQMTSMRAIKGRDIDIKEAKVKLIETFRRHFQ